MPRRPLLHVDRSLTAPTRHLLAVVGNKDAETAIVTAALASAKAGGLIERLNLIVVGRLILARKTRVRNKADKEVFKAWLTEMGLVSHFSWKCQTMAALFICIPTTVYTSRVAALRQRASAITSKSTAKNPKMHGQWMTEQELGLLKTPFHAAVIKGASGVAVEYPPVMGRDIKWLAVLLGKTKPLYMDTEDAEKVDDAFRFWTPEDQKKEKKGKKRSASAGWRW